MAISLMNAEQIFFITGFFRFTCVSSTAGQAEVPRSNAQLSLPVSGVAERYPPYDDTTTKFGNELMANGTASIRAIGDTMTEALLLEKSHQILVNGSEIANSTQSKRYGLCPVMGGWRRKRRAKKLACPFARHHRLFTSPADR